MVGAYVVVLLAAAIGFNQEIGKTLSSGWSGLDQRLWWMPVVLWALWGVLKANFDQWDIEKNRADGLQYELSELRDSFRWLVAVQTSVFLIGPLKADISKAIAQMGVQLYNGSALPMRFEMEEMSVSVSGIAADPVPRDRRGGILLPYQTIQHMCPPIPNIPYILPMEARVAFAFTYGPASGQQLYRRAGEFTAFAAQVIEDGQIVSRMEWIKDATCEPLSSAPSVPSAPRTPEAPPQ